MTISPVARPLDPMEPITISITPGGSGFTIVQRNRSCSHLGFDEMIGQLIGLTHPLVRRPHFEMLTPAENNLREAKHALRRAEVAVRDERAAAAPDELSRVTNGAL